MERYAWIDGWMDGWLDEVALLCECMLGITDPESNLDVV